MMLDLLVDTKDAIGANAVNTMAEKVAPLLAEITGGRLICEFCPIWQYIVWQESVCM